MRMDDEDLAAKCLVAGAIRRGIVNADGSIGGAYARYLQRLEEAKQAASVPSGTDDV